MRKLLLSAAIAALAAFAIYVVETGTLVKTANRPACCAANAGVAPSSAGLTLDPSLFQGEVKQAYLIAQRHPDILMQLHCYCGCEQVDGHRSLLDCYRDRHGATCPICSGEALMAGRMADQGMTVAQISDAIRARYSHGS
ncbi:MAG: hypothetical protein IVW54_17610 [Candidatus Binataceae bacterium]|nr:hypothetical protein [Candidatus Binataceae bacterium]